MKISAFTILVYAILVLVGGIMGHLKAGSVVSLITGVLFGTTLLGLSIACFFKKSLGQYASLGLVIALDAFFTYRLAATQKFFPSGMMSLISLAVLLILAVQLRKKATA